MRFVAQTPVSAASWTLRRNGGREPCEPHAKLDTLDAMKKRLALSLLVLSLGFSASLPSGAPEQNGMSADRLNRIHVVMKKHIESADLAGAPGLISRNGKIVFRGTWGDYKPETIVRMYSMTKGVTGVAAMILYEEGLYSMNDPLSKYLPEFSKTRVGKDSAPEWPRGNQNDVYQVVIDGSPSITQETAFRFTDDSGRDAAAAGCLATGLRALNAIPAVNELPPGWVTPLDLPLIVGHGTIR